MANSSFNKKEQQLIEHELRPNHSMSGGILTQEIALFCNLVQIFVQNINQQLNIVCVAEPPYEDIYIDPTFTLVFNTISG